MADIQTETKHCDRKDGDVKCTELATLAYLFDWGEQGICCAKHAGLLQQTASQIQRSVSVYPLPSSAPVPLTRDERTQLHAKALSLETEADELKARGLDLYRINGQQQHTINTLTVQKRELEAVVKDMEGSITTLRGQLETRDAEHAELVVEIERLRHLEALFEAAPAGRGGQDTSVVE